MFAQTKWLVGYWIEAPHRGFDQRSVCEVAGIPGNRLYPVGIAAFCGSSSAHANKAILTWLSILWPLKKGVFYPFLLDWLLFIQFAYRFTQDEGWGNILSGLMHVVLKGWYFATMCKGCGKPLEQSHLKICPFLCFSDLMSGSVPLDVWWIDNICYSPLGRLVDVLCSRHIGGHAHTEKDRFSNVL